MQDKKMPFSGPYASYLTTVSILRLQLMISTQFTDQECLDWEKSLRIDLAETNFEIVNDEILGRLKEAQFFILNELRLSSISSAVINFTSTTEHYIKDMIELSLKRNSSLRKKAFSNYKISALELEEDLSLNDIKKRIFKIISAEQSKGELFSMKFKKATSFLSIGNFTAQTELFKSLDSLWKLRNKIAHSNKGFIKVFEISTPKGLIILNNEPQKKEYLNFSISLLEIIDDFTKYLKEWDSTVLEKWPASSFVK